MVPSTGHCQSRSGLRRPDRQKDGVVEFGLRPIRFVQNKVSRSSAPAYIVRSRYGTCAPPSTEAPVSAESAERGRWGSLARDSPALDRLAYLFHGSKRQRQKGSEPPSKSDPLPKSLATCVAGLEDRAYSPRRYKHVRVFRKPLRRPRARSREARAVINSLAGPMYEAPHRTPVLDTFVPYTAWLRQGWPTGGRVTLPLKFLFGRTIPIQTPYVIDIASV
jgi:hypothetical protein